MNVERINESQCGEVFTASQLVEVLNGFIEVEEQKVNVLETTERPDPLAPSDQHIAFALKAAELYGGIRVLSALSSAISLRKITPPTTEN